jgi:streptogramin lyase
MPVGYSFMGSQYSEAQLLSLANAFQMAGPPLPAPQLGPAQSASAAEQPLLDGTVISSPGMALAGVPVKAHRANSNVTVVAYTDARGEYSFPVWSDVRSGTYSVTIEIPDFDQVQKEGIDLSGGETKRVDFALKSKPVAYEDATTSEIIAGLAGTGQQKVLLSQCSGCHTLQWALRVPHTKREWAQVITKMAGKSAAQSVMPDTYAFGQKRFIEPLADYLASIRGPGSSDQIPFEPSPRPTDQASTNLVVTEYDLPRGGQRELYMFRGDSRYVWPHDVIIDSSYAYYTDHFSFILGRLDRRSGEVKEMPFPLPPGVGRNPLTADDRPGSPDGHGAHELAFDHQGNIVIGMYGGTVKYNPTTGQFTGWASGSSMFGLGPDGNVWYEESGKLIKIDASSETLRQSIYPVPTNDGIYDIDTDSKGRSDIFLWNNGKIATFDPNSMEYAEYKLPTPMAGPRRGQIDAQDSLWAAEFYSGRIARFDPDKKVVKEYSLLPGHEAYTAPYPMPYTTSVDDKNQVVWTTDFSSSRIFRFDIKTEKMTEYMMPSNYEVRDLKADPSAPRITVWLPAYRPPSKLVKIEVR